MKLNTSYKNIKHLLFLFIWCDRTEDLRHLGNNIKYNVFHIIDYKRFYHYIIVAQIT